MNAQSLSLHWFRQDLRLTDNPSLNHAAEKAPVIAVYIHDPDSEKPRGEASSWWLQQSLHSLQQQLQQYHGAQLYCFVGKPGDILQQLVKQLPITHVSWNRCYEPWQIKRDTEIKTQLKACNIDVHSFNGALLFEPWQVTKPDGSAYQIFTPYYKKSMQQLMSKTLPNAEAVLQFYQGDIASAKTLDACAISQPKHWQHQLQQNCNIGEAAAKDKLSNFLHNGLSDYREARDFPAQQATSCLSAHLHFGEISPRQIYFASQHACDDDRKEAFVRQLMWRDFSYYQLFHHADMDQQPLRREFIHYPWNNNPAQLKQWQQGQTGIPIIDAGMRELWQTGTMHNRVRMLVASFLVKNLRIHWHHGAAWFWDCLVDADLANNSAGWQWVAGCGVDSAPYFRIFNPVTQSQNIGC